MTLKEQVRDHYLQKWTAFSEAIKEQEGHEKWPQPHLLSTKIDFDKDWWAADLRMMIFGISTNGWDCKKPVYDMAPTEAVDSLMKFYEQFYFNNGNWHYGHPFWNYFYAIHELLQAKLKKNIAVVWNNVYKIGEGVNENVFSVSVEEIRIFKPEIILVLGVNASNVLHDRLNGKMENWNNCKRTYFDTNDEREKLLYYSLDSRHYPGFKHFLKKWFITYHPNAHGDSGIKLKLLVDELEKETKEISEPT